MDYKKLFGYGMVVWVVPYLVATAFAGYKVADQTWAVIVVVLASLVAAYWAGRYLLMPSMAAVLKYSIPWVIIGFVLNVVFTVPFVKDGWRFFYSWYALLASAIVLIVPMFANKKTPAPKM